MVVVKKYAVNIPCSIQSRVIHAKMIFRVLHAKLTEYLSRVSLGVILNRFSNDIDDVDNNIGTIIDGSLYYLFNTFTDIYGIIKGVSNLLMIVPITVYIIVGFVRRVKYMSAKRELLRLFAITKSPIVGIGASCAFGGPIIRSLGNQDYFIRKMDHKIEENSKNGLLNVATDGWFTTIMRLLNVIVVLIPSYTILLYSLYKDYDPTKPKSDNTAIAFFLLNAVSFAGDFTGFLT